MSGDMGKLSDVAKVQSGFAFKSRDWRGDGVPVIKIQNVRAGRVKLEGCSYVSDEVAVTASRYRLYRGDVLVTMSGEIGSVGVVRTDEHLLLNQRVGRIVLLDPDAAENRYIAYALQDPCIKSMMEAIAYGAAQPNISPTLIGSLPLWLPPRATQTAIANVLEAFDDLIENNRRRVEMLEEMARTIYREWFVKFRFPGHEHAPMVDSALGPIPEGWQVGRVDSLILLQRGFDLPLKVRESGPIPVVGASGVQGSHLAAKATGPGVVTGRSGTIGVVNYVPGDFWPLNTSLWVREFRLATPRYAYFLLEGLDLKRAASGSAVPSLDRKVVHGLPVVCPPPNLIEGWDTRVAGMFEAVEALRSQSTRLSAIRDLLLPTLVTGQIDVSTLDLDALVSTGSTEESAVAQ